MSKHLIPRLLAGALAVLAAGPALAQQTKIGIVAFQMSSETHARAAGAAEAAAKKKGWDVTLLNSRGAMPEHAAQLENLIQSKVAGIVVAMGKPVEMDAQLAAAKAAGIPVVTIMSGASPSAVVDIQTNEYGIGGQIGLHLLGQINYQGAILTERFDGNVATRIRGKVLDQVLSENTGVSVLASHSMARTASWREDVKAGMEALILKNKGKFTGIWASFDGQAFVIDDILKGMGYKKGEVALTGVDGGQEAFARIRDPQSMLTATVAIPFERMGESAIDLLDKIVLGKKTKAEVAPGPYLFMDAVLVDKTNVPADGKWPW